MILLMDDRTVHAVVTLDVTLADVCKMNNIPMLSIISTNVTAPIPQSLREGGENWHETTE